MTKKSKQVVTDTVVIIDAHEHAYWSPLCHAYHVALPAFILENEAFYFKSDRGKTIGMNPTEWVKQGKVIRIEAALEDFEVLSKRITPDFMSALDAGEREAIAILLSKNHKDLFFSTADRLAIKALGVLGLGSRGISVEELLEKCGIKRKGGVKLPERFTKKWFQQALAEGLSEQCLWLRR